MARIRTIKPEFWTDEKIGNLKRDERLLFIGLWNLADDEGVVKASPAFIKGQLFSYDVELRLNTVVEWIDSLQNARMIIPFIFNNESYFVIRTFIDHQVINRPSKSKIPASILNEINDSVSAHGVFTEGSQPERKGKEQGKERNREQGTREGFSENENFLIPQIIQTYADTFPEFIRDQKKDNFSARRIFEIISGNANVEKVNHAEFLTAWKSVCEGIRDKKNVQFYAGNGLSTIANNLPTIIQKVRSNGAKSNQNRVYSEDDFKD